MLLATGVSRRSRSEYDGCFHANTVLKSDMTLKQKLGRMLFANMPFTRFLFDQIRIELNALWLMSLNCVWPPQIKKMKELRMHDGLYVNVGCGPHIEPGFINIDLFPAAPQVLRWDCRWNLPLKESTSLGIRAEHFFEHLEVKEEVPSFLSDCVRILKPGGVLRLIVPDAQRYLDAYMRNDLSGFVELNCQIPFPKDLPTRMDVVNHVFHQYHEHRWGYDFENIRNRLESAGFTQVHRMQYGRSLIEKLACDRAVHAPYSLYVDAVKV